jgi:hypothetical protein
LDRVNNTVAMLQAGGIAVYPLAALVIVAVVIAVEKSFVLSVRTHLPAHIIGMIETYDFAWDELAKQLDKLNRRNYLVRFLRIILENRAHQAWWVESRAADAASD